MDYLSSTISAASNIVSQKTDWAFLFDSPFIKYLLSPAVVFAVILFVAYKLLNIGKLLQKFDDALKDIDKLDRNMQRLLSHMDIVKTHLVTKTGMDASLFASGSPVFLLKKGKELLNLSGFKTIYTNNKDWFINQFRRETISTLADIDSHSLEVMENMRDDPKLENFKNIAFDNGTSVDVLLRVCAIYLRDEVAKEILNKSE